MHRTIPTHDRANRPGRMPHPSAGLSTLEFLGCAVAIVVGAWIGASYLGKDTNQLAYDVLSQSQLLDKVPDSLRPTPPPGTATTREQALTNYREELGSLRQQISTLQTGTNPANEETVSPQPPAEDSTARVPTQERTLAYWQQLNELVLSEAELQRNAERALNETNAAKVFALKARICRFTAKTVAGIPPCAVCEDALRFGKQLELWYADGGELYERAVQIWETPTGPQAREKMIDDWKLTDQHHRNEARLVKERAAAARGTIERIFGSEFPSFAQPAETQ